MSDPLDLYMIPSMYEWSLGSMNDQLSVQVIFQSMDDTLFVGVISGFHVSYIEKWESWAIIIVFVVDYIVAYIQMIYLKENHCSLSFFGSNANLHMVYEKGTFKFKVKNL